ncbi:MAG: YcjF family protein [Deinococcales bacterium]
MSEIKIYKAPHTQVPILTGAAEHEACGRLIRDRALWCAGVSLEPVPFLDLAVILPIHIKMVLDIGKIYGFDVTRERAKEIALELMGTIALNYAARVATRGAMKAVPVLGALVNAPIVYATTLTLGGLAERYFRARRPELPALEVKLQQELLANAKSAAKQLDWRTILRGLAKNKKP